MTSSNLKNTILYIAVIFAACGGGLLQDAAAQGNTASGGAKSDAGSAPMKLQRSVAIYNFKTTAESGPLRGQEIYFYKCWMCHNTYTVKGGTGAVPLKDIFKRPKLVTTGQPVSDATVTEKIKNGSAKMPAYRSTLSDTDIADLLSYLRDDICCFEGLEPPKNPLYRY